METKIEGFGGIKFWMQRVAEEHSKLAKERIDRVGILFFQIYNFDKMQDEVKDKVVGDLIKDIESLFGEQAERIKEEYFMEVKQEAMQSEARHSSQA